MSDPRSRSVGRAPSNWPGADEVIKKSNVTSWNDLAYRLLGISAPSTVSDEMAEDIPVNMSALRSRVRRCMIGTLEDFALTWPLLLEMVPGLSERFYVEAVLKKARYMYVSRRDFDFPPRLMKRYAKLETEVYDYARSVLIMKSEGKQRPPFQLSGWVVRAETSHSQWRDSIVSAPTERLYELDAAEARQRAMGKHPRGSTRYIGSSPCSGEFFRSPAYKASGYVCGVFTTLTGDSCCCRAAPPTSDILAVNGDLFCLPSVFVVGAQKAGTTILSFYLSEMYPSGVAAKECHSMTNEHFVPSGHHQCSLSNIRAEELPTLLYFEAAPYYSISPAYSYFFAHYYDSSPIVYLVRDPVLRAVSGYKMDLRRYNSSDVPDMNEIFLAELDALENCLGSSPGMAEFVTCFEVSARATKRASYLYRSLYSRHLALWAHFNRKVLVLQFEDVTTKDPAHLRQVLNQVTSFFNLPPKSIPEPFTSKEIEKWAAYYHMPEFWYSQSQLSEQPQLLPETERALRKFFAPFNRELQSLVPFELPWAT